MAGKLWTASSPLLLGPDRYVGGNPPDYGDTKQYWAYIYDKADAQHARDEASILFSLAVAELNEGQLDELYDFYAPLTHERSPLRAQDFGRGHFHELAQRFRTDPNAAVNNPALRSDFNFFAVASKPHFEQIAGKIESLLGPQKTAALVKRLEQIHSPHDPYYDKPRTVGSYDADIQAMRNKLSGMDETRRAEMNGLLDRAALLTRETSDEVAAYYRYMDKDVDDFVQKNPRPRCAQVIEQKIGVDAFKQIRTIGTGQYADLSISSAESTPAFATLVQKGYQVKEPKLTRKYRDAVLQMLRGMDAMTEDYRRYDGGMATLDAWLPGAPEQDGKNVLFNSEQGDKYYGLYPVAGALIRLKDTLRKGDLDGLKAAVENAEAKKKAVGGLLDIAHKQFSPRGMFSANVASTRKGVKNNVPEEFLSDYTGHCQVNSIYHLYAFCKNMGVSFEDVLDKPAETMRRVTERYLKDNGVNSRKNPGAALLRFSNPASDLWYISIDNMLDRMLGRGQDGVAGGEPDDKKADEYRGACTLAKGVCMEHVAQENQLYKALIDLSPEKQKALNQYIALQTGECDFRAAAKAFQDENWRQKLAELSSQTAEPDYNALAKRTAEILKGMEEERATCGKFGIRTMSRDRDEDQSVDDQYLRDAHEAYLRVLRDAPAEARNTPAFRRFRQSVMDMPKLARSPDARRELERAAAEERTADTLVHRGDDLTDMLKAFGLPTGEALAAVDAKTHPISGSAEYQKMARALLTAMKERELNGSYNPKHDKLIRDACVEYCLAKPTVRKTQSGRDRFNRALNLMMAVSLGDDPEVKDCFDRINAARGFTDITVQEDAKARELDNYLTPEQFGFDLRHAQRETERVMRWRGEAGGNALTVFTSAMNSLDEIVVDSRQSNVSERLSIVQTEKTQFTAKEFVDRLQSMHDTTLLEHKVRAEQSGEDAITALTARGAAARYMLAGQITKLLYGPDQPVDVARVAQLTNQTWKEYELDYRIPDAPVETPAQQKALLKDLNELGRTWLESQNIELAQPEPAARPEPSKTIARKGEKLTL